MPRQRISVNPVYRVGDMVTIRRDSDRWRWADGGLMDWLIGATVPIHRITSRAEFTVIDTYNPRPYRGREWFLQFSDIEVRRDMDIFTREDEEGNVIELCAICDGDIDSDTEHYDNNGYSICESCFNDNYFVCDDCGNTANMEDHHDVDGDSRVVCDDCFETDYFHCDGCQEDRHTDVRWASDGNRDICDSCSTDYVICYDCDSIISSEDAIESGDGEMYCPSCARNIREQLIHTYSYRPRPIFYGVSPSEKPYGVELEIDDGDNNDDCAEAISDIADGGVYFKEDGSLDDGFEIVSHPMSLSYHLTVFDWSKVLQCAKDYSFKSHNTRTCGLHVHADREHFGDDKTTQDLNIAKIMLLFDKFWESDIVPFSRRDIGRLDRWASKPNADIISSDSDRVAIRKANNTANKGRYQAVNLQNEHTVEFRIFRGTLNDITFKATLQWVDTLIKFVAVTPLSKLWDVEFGDIFKDTEYSELKSYLTKRNLLEVI